MNPPATGRVEIRPQRYAATPSGVWTTLARELWVPLVSNMAPVERRAEATSAALVEPGITTGRR